MTEPTVQCPNCSSEIKLTESLAGPLIEATKQRYEAKLAQREADYSKRESTLRAQQQKLATDRETLENEIAARLKTERKAIADEEAAKAKRALSIEFDRKEREVADLKKVVLDRDAKLGEAQKVQAEVMRKARELDDAKRELDLTVERRVQDSLVTVRENALKEAEDALRLKVREKEEQISSMQRQIEDLKRKAEQGSQQLQGEVFELDLETTLRARFPNDEIAPVPKGEFGGDVLQTVKNSAGQACGTIIWELKRTKNWSDAWLGKLRDDQRRAKADVALLVSVAKPKDLQLFDFRDGVWVSEVRCSIPVAMTIRESLIALATARQTTTGLTTKTELIYQYLTGPRFRHHVEAIVEKFTEMQDDLEKERRTLMRLWAKREEQIRTVLDATAGMYGDLQGIAGKSLEEIEGLETKLLDPPARGAA